jgi:drug/metabolite transporter (DMT)-like permease
LPGGERESASLAAVLGLVYQGIVVSGLSFIGWVALLRRHSPGRLTVFSFLTPLIGVLLSSVFFSEKVTARLALGLLAVAVGIFLASRGGGRMESEPAANDEA